MRMWIMVLLPNLQMPKLGAKGRAATDVSASFQGRQRSLTTPSGTVLQNLGAQSQGPNLHTALRGTGVTCFSQALASGQDPGDRTQLTSAFCLPGTPTGNACEFFSSASCFHSCQE